MRLLDFGGATVAVDHADVPPTLSAFLNRAAGNGAGLAADLVMRIGHGEPRLVFDADTRIVSLTLPEPGTVDEHTVCIGVLQAAARCVALIPGTGLHLLHGSATSVDHEGGAVAILDGGRGQGKTSLALGLSLGGVTGPVADEFLFIREEHTRLATAGAPRLPWHIRTDMAPYLAPDHGHERLLFPDDLQPMYGPVAKETEVRAVLIPAAGLDAGRVAPVLPSATSALLRYALTDHMAKLLDPAFDHVSIFSSPDQLVTADGEPLATRYAARIPIAPAVVGLARLPTFLVGIGAPEDIHISAAAALDALEGLP